MNNKIIGSVIITGMLTAGLSGCATNQQARNQNNMQRVQYQTQNLTGQNINRNTTGNYPYDNNGRYIGYGTNNNVNMRVGQNPNNNIVSDNNLGILDRNDGKLGNVGHNINFGNNAKFGLNYAPITVSGNTLTVPKQNVVSRNNVNYVDITPYCNLADTEEQLNARKVNYGRVSTNNSTGKYSPVPMGSINLPGCTSFVEFDEKNPNLIYVKDAPNDNTLVSKPITLSNNEAIRIENGRVLCPASTLQKIVAQKTVTNPSSLKVNITR